jgi:hypothetical protein
MWARRLSIRREGPERAEEKKRRRVLVSFGKTAALVVSPARRRETGPR